MPHLYTSTRLNVGGAAQIGGYVYEKGDATSVLDLKISEESAYNRRTVPIKYRGAVYLIGTWARARVRDRFGGYHPSGVRPPVTKPTLADAAFAGGSEGEMIGYQTFVMKVGNVKIAESNPGPQTLTLSAAGTGREWDNLDWAPFDSHVTHSRGYVSVDGSIPALAWERPIQPAGSTVIENVGTAALGETLPVRKGVNQQFMLDIFARGVPPYTQWAEEYHNAFFYAGDPNHPERIYYSKLYEPEAVNSTPLFIFGRQDNPWLETTDGLPVTGIRRQGDELIVGTPRGIDRIQGYGYGDYAIHRISNYWNVLAAFSMLRAGPNDSLFFASSHGPTIYNAGNFRYIGGPIQGWWREQLRLYPTLFEDVFAVEDRYFETVKFLIPQQDNTTLYLVVDYNSAEAGQPIWVFDRRARRDNVSAELAINGSTKYYELYTGSCDGNVRQENVEDDADDDGDTYQKQLTVETGHRYMGDQRGDQGHGRSFGPLDNYVMHEDQAVTVSLFSGEDDSPNALSAADSKTIPATGPKPGQRRRTAMTSERVAVQGVSGKGVTYRLTALAPVNVQFRGWGVEHKHGPAGAQPFEQ